MDSGIRSLDSARLLLIVERTCDQLKSAGVDLKEPCSDVPEKTKCWLRLQLPAVNKVLWKVCMQLVEHAPGALTLAHFERPDIYTVRTDTAFMDGAVVLCSLLRHHACIKRLLLNAMAFPLWYFPSTARQRTALQPRRRRGRRRPSGHGSSLGPSAIALASALKRNITLRKLRVCHLADDAPGIILASLKSNEALEELSLDRSDDFSRSTLWEGLQALRENTGAQTPGNNVRPLDGQLRDSPR
ncbi:hypothetical protein HPB51_019664 [Rhipicephalus microplus]|uniref:Uncharacterized protein n=1 Tax=Rhipicephalus microplus TaxID=6941 RepID=A0A9J6EBG8_RHIMP|nr:hypothetical protein HPB51_019664 [Rhipicephalus microplus]